MNNTGNDDTLVSCEWLSVRKCPPALWAAHGAELFSTCICLYCFCSVPCLTAVQTAKVGDPKHLPPQRPTTYKKQVLHSLCLMTGISKCDSWTHGLPLCALWILTGSIPGCWYRMMSPCMFCVRLVEAGCEERQSRPLPYWCVSTLVPSWNKTYSTMKDFPQTRGPVWKRAHRTQFKKGLGGEDVNEIIYWL